MFVFFFTSMHYLHFTLSLDPFDIRMFAESVISVLLLYVFNRFYHFVFAKPSENSPPGLPRIPFLGSYGFLLWGNYKFPHETIRHYVDKYKSKIVGCWLGDYYTVVATNYESIKELLNTQKFDGRLSNAYIFRARMFGRKLGIFFNDGQTWRDQRRFALREMRDHGFGRRMDKVESDFGEELSSIIDTLKNGPINDYERNLFRNENREVSFPEILYPTACNFFLAIFTGDRVPRSEHHKLRELTQAAANFQRYSDTTGGAILFAPWLRHIAHGFSFPGFLKGSTGITSFIRKCFRAQESSFIDEAKRGFLDVCIQRLKENEELSSFSEDHLLMLGTDFIFPAVTANPWAVTTFVKYMMHHPSVMRKVQNEIDTVIGRDRLITLNDRVNLPYTEAAIREILRADTMTPWSVAHRAMEAGELCGFDIPKDTVLVTDLYSMHHDPELWGDPENVRPERFLNENGTLGKDYSLPFGAGGRLCAGETFARQFQFLLSSTLMQNFDFSFVEGEPSAIEDKLPGFASSPKDFFIRVTPRQ